MITLIGKITIFSSIIFGMLYVILPDYGTKKPQILSLYLGNFKKGDSFFYLQVLSIFIAFLVLAYAFVTDDFSVQNVFFYSSTKQPLMYKIASLWGNHDASLLFFITLLALVSFISSLYIGTPSSIKIMSLILIIFMLIIYFTSNPFFHLSHTPIEGMGMNPVLQDMAIAIHPPMLYFGYVIYMVPYTCFMGILLNPGDINVKNTISLAYIASKFGLGFLTLGISLGSWWAYRELGWGGYWFFDPVENISLIPWLVGIALHHSFMITRRTGKLYSLTIALGLMNFLLILFGILLVRSGALISVHSFAAGIMGGKYIIGSFVLLVIISLALYILKMKPSKLENYTFSEKGIIAGNIVIAASTICLMIGTFFPILYQLVKGVNISLSNQYFYYSFIPLAILIVLMSSLIPHIKSGFKFSLNIRNSAMILSHMGVVILAIGVTLNVWMKHDIEFIGKINTNIKYGDTSITLRNIKYSSGPNYYRQIGEFWIEDKNDIIILKPENRLYTVENAVSAESDIYSFVQKDIYAVLGNLEDDGTLHANIYMRPWMSLIWMGMFLTSLGIVVSAISKNRIIYQ